MADPRVYAGRKVGKTKSSISTSHIINAVNEAGRALTSQNTTIASRIGAGMRAMVSLSKAVGLGGKLPFTIRDVDSNTRWVLGQLGIDSQAIVRVGQMDTALAKQGQSTAIDIFNAVTGGKFDQAHANRTSPAMIALARADAAYAKQIREQQEAQSERLLDVSPYAMDLLAFAPKFKFLFVVEITLNAPYVDVDSTFQKQFAFVVKKASRPDVKYITEDVNYYNHRTKVVTKASWDDMTMQFYDDGMNNAATFFSLYTRSMSPVMNIANASGMIAAEQLGMTGKPFHQSSPIGNAGVMSVQRSNSSSVGPLMNDNKTIVREIKIFQVYGNGKYVNTYTFINPRITDLALDDLDMSAGDGINHLDIKFEYDSVYVELNQNFADMRLQEITNAGLYPLRDVSGQQTRNMMSKNWLYGQENPDFEGPPSSAATTSSMMRDINKTIITDKNVVQRAGQAVATNFFDKYKNEISTAGNLIAGALNVFGKAK